LIISEYIEGSSNNKALEVYNCGTTNLTPSDYGICLFSNNNTTCNSSDMLTGSSLATGQVYTLCNSQAASGISNNCDQNSGTTNFNGNDRLIIFEDTDGDDSYSANTDTLVDAFGDPNTPVSSGFPWSDTTYRRCNIMPYTAMMPFMVGDYYTSHPQDDFSDYGMAPTATSCPTP
jgi:hypothetical protein